MNYDKRLEELFIELPEPAQSASGVVGAIAAGKLLYVGGQLPFVSGKVSFKGRLGVEISLDQGRLAARHATLMAVSQLRQALGSLNKVQRVVQLAGFVASGGDFQDHDRVIDSASALLEEIFGSNGKHARVVAGVHSLPKGACVEVALLVSIC